MANIKNIKVGDTNYDIEALHFVAGDLDTPAQWKAYIDRIAELGFEIVVLTTLPKADATSYETYHNNIVLVTESASVTGSSVEYVIVRSGTSGSYTYKWERIGTTTADLTAYAKVGVPTSGPSTADTSSTNLGTKTTTAALANSTGTVDITKITYQKSSAATEKAGSSTATTNTEPGGGVTIDGSKFTFTGADKPVSVVISAATAAAVSAHEYTPAGTITMSHDAIKSVSLSASTTSTDGPQYVQSITHTAATLGGITSFNIDAYKASVTETTLVLTPASKDTVTINGGGITPVIRYMKPAGTKASVSGSFAGTKTTIKHTVTQPTFTGSFNSKNVTGAIGGSQIVSDHTHTYLELKEHTHDISLTATAVTGSASAAMVEHTHTVTIGSHSHTLNSHTHTQK